MKKELLFVAIFFGGLAFVGNVDLKSAEVTSKIVKETDKKILSYSIKQSGLNPAYESNPFPLTLPVQVKK